MNDNSVVVIVQLTCSPWPESGRVEQALPVIEEVLVVLDFPVSILAKRTDNFGLASSQ